MAFYVIGAIASHTQRGALGLSGVQSSADWQQQLLEGGIGLINRVLNTLFAFMMTRWERAAMAPFWVATALIIALLLALRRWPRGRVGTGLRLAAAAASLSIPLAGGSSRGKLLTGYTLDNRPSNSRFVFAAEAQPRLPPSLLKDNAAGTLRLLHMDSEFFVFLGSDRTSVWWVRASDVLLRETHTSDALR